MSMFNKCHIHLCNCTWLNVFLHAQSLLIKHKNIFECFSCFWKIFCLCKNVKKISKIVLPCFGDSVASWSSRMSQSRAHTEIFRSSLAGQCPSREKYLEYFSKVGFLMFLVTQSGDLFAGGRFSYERTQIFSWLTSRLSRE